MQGAGREAGGVHPEESVPFLFFARCPTSLPVQEATWRRLQSKFGDGSKGSEEGGGGHDVLDVSEVGRYGDDTRQAEPDD